MTVENGLVNHRSYRLPNKPQDFQDSLEPDGVGAGTESSLATLPTSLWKAEQSSAFIEKRNYVGKQL